MQPGIDGTSKIMAPQKQPPEELAENRQFQWPYQPKSLRIGKIVSKMG
jgi:hypothetical protein